MWKEQQVAWWLWWTGWVLGLLHIHSTFLLSGALQALFSCLRLSAVSPSSSSLSSFRRRKAVRSRKYRNRWSPSSSVVIHLCLCCSLYNILMQFLVKILAYDVYYWMDSQFNLYTSTNVGWPICLNPQLHKEIVTFYILQPLRWDGKSISYWIVIDIGLHFSLSSS